MVLPIQNKLENIGIQNNLIDRYVDDITVLPTTILKPGNKITGDKIVFCKEKYNEDLNIPGDIRTIKIIEEIANSIDDNIKVTFNVPSNNED